MIVLTVPTQYLSDTCAGGSWTRDEDSANGFESYTAALDAVDACEICAPMSSQLDRSCLGITWDVIALSPHWSESERRIR